MDDREKPKCLGEKDQPLVSELTDCYVQVIVVWFWQNICFIFSGVCNYRGRNVSCQNRSLQPTWPTVQGDDCGKYNW